MNILKKIIKSQKQLLELLIACESETASLYETFSQGIPEESAFWSKLAAIERRHAEWLEGCREQLEREVVFRGFSRLKASSATKLLKYIWARQIEAEETPPQAYYAVLVALQVESSIVESRILKSIRPMAGKGGIHLVASKLASETAEHVALLQMEQVKHERILKREKKPFPPPPPPLTEA